MWGAASPPHPPAAFEKSGGKPAGKLLLISNGICWPAAHRERRACFVCRKLERKNRRLARKDGKQPASQGGRRARTARTKHGRGPTAPAPLLWFCGPFGPAKRRRPPAHTQRPPATPRHPRLYRPYAGDPGEGGKPDAALWGAAAFGGGAAQWAAPPAKQKAGAGGSASGSRFSGRFAPCRRPPWALEAPQRPNDRAVPPHAPPAGTERRKTSENLKPFVNNF